MDRIERELAWTAWMRQAIDGDEQVYRHLLESLAADLRSSVRARFARWGCGDIDVEDVVQETLLAIHLKRHTWNRDEKLGPWVAAISRNKLVDVMRRRGRRVELPIDDLVEVLADETVGTDHAARDAGRDVAQMLAGLNERQQQIVRWISIEGYSVRQAAERLQMTEVAVRVALHRSLKFLAKYYRAELP
ncbi:MAG: sigma-70 family RNA polymerase sigma factor [Pseudomonadota bacterium]